MTTLQLLNFLQNQNSRNTEKKYEILKFINLIKLKIK